MKHFFFTALAAALLASSSSAFKIFQDDPSPAVVRLGTHRKTVPDRVQRDALRRRQTVTETLDNEVSSWSRMHAVIASGDLARYYRPSCTQTGWET